MIPKEPYSAWGVSETDYPKNGKIEDKLRFIVKYAILAPSSHNTQPWLFTVSKNIVRILPNLDRTLKYSDRTYRELYISLGCALANLLIAGGYFGFNLKVEYLPEEDVGNVAVKITFTGAQNKDAQSSLFPYITERVTDRTTYMRKSVDRDVIDEVRLYTRDCKVEINFILDKTQNKDISNLIHKASIFAFGDKYFKSELADWVGSVYSRSNKGIALFGFEIPEPVTIFAKPMIRNVPAWFQAGKDRRQVRTSPLLLVVSAKEDTKTAWIETGKAFVYASLALAKNNVVVAPMAGVIEYQPTREVLKSLIKTSGYPMFFARAGYSKSKVHHAPRVSAEQTITS